METIRKQQNIVEKREHDVYATYMSTDREKILEQERREHMYIIHACQQNEIKENIC